MHVISVSHASGHSGYRRYAGISIEVLEGIEMPYSSFQTQNTRVLALFTNSSLVFICILVPWLSCESVGGCIIMMDIDTATKAKILANDKTELWNSVFIKPEPEEYSPVSNRIYSMDLAVKSDLEDTTLSTRQSILTITKNSNDSRECIHSINVTNISEKRRDYRMKRGLQSASSMLGRRKIHWCDQCQREFKTAQSLRYHIGTHTGNKLFHCSVCNKGFQRLYDMNDHMRIHSNIKPYECGICKKGFLRPRDLKFHMAVHSDQKPHECPVCKKRFLRTHDLKEHVGTHSNEKPHKCNICNKGFQRADRLRSHINTHAETKPYICPVCAKGLSRSFDLKVHMRTHSDVKPFQCQICKQGFLRRCDLTSHMHIHENKKPFVCDICNKGFVRMSYLRVHKRIHLDEKPFECEICYKRFIRTHDLNIHMRWHTGEKPFECDICKKRFRNHHAMKLHIMAHMEGGRPYKCPICNRGFQRADFVNIHLKTHRRKGEISETDQILLTSAPKEQSKNPMILLENSLAPDDLECIEIENQSGHTLINQEIVSMLKTELGTCSDTQDERSQEIITYNSVPSEDDYDYGDNVPVQSNDGKDRIESNIITKDIVQHRNYNTQSEMTFIKSEPMDTPDNKHVDTVNTFERNEQLECVNIKNEPIETD